MHAEQVLLVALVARAVEDRAGIGLAIDRDGAQRVVGHRGVAQHGGAGWSEAESEEKHGGGQESKGKMTHHEPIEGDCGAFAAARARL